MVILISPKFLYAVIWQATWLAIIPELESRPSLSQRYESIEDDEMREVDIGEHHEELAHGIPEHLGTTPHSSVLINN